MLALSSDGRCVRATINSYKTSTTTEHIFSDPSGPFTLRMHSNAFDKKNVFDLSLPLPFGRKIHTPPILFEWSKAAAMKVKDLDTLLRRLHVESQKEKQPTPYRFVDVLSVSQKVESAEEGDVDSLIDDDEFSDFEKSDEDESFGEEETPISDDDDEEDFEDA